MSLFIYWTNFKDNFFVNDLGDICIQIIDIHTFLLF